MGLPWRSQKIRQTVEAKFLRPHMSPGSPEEFTAIPGADAKLKNPAISHQIPAAPDDAGVGERGAQIVIPQIRVGIEMDNVEIRVALDSRADGPQGDQMLAASMTGSFPSPRMIWVRS